MNKHENPENIIISRRLETVLDQLESVNFFDKETCEHTSECSKSVEDKLKPEPKSE